LILWFHVNTIFLLTGGLLVVVALVFAVLYPTSAEREKGLAE